MESNFRRKSQKERNSLFQQCQNVVFCIVRAFIPFFFRTILYWIWPNFVKCLISEWTVVTWWEYGFVKDSSTSLKSAVKFKSEKCYIKTKTIMGLFPTRLKKDDSSDNLLISLYTTMKVPTTLLFLDLWRKGAKIWSWILHQLIQKKREQRK